MRDFLNGIDNLHEYMRFSYNKMKPPSFIVEKETSTGLEFHYRSKRKGLLYFLIGQIKQVGCQFYSFGLWILYIRYIEIVMNYLSRSVARSTSSIAK